MRSGSDRGIGGASRSGALRESQLSKSNDASRDDEPSGVLMRMADHHTVELLDAAV
jgi:hypothetical protein